MTDGPSIETVLVRNIRYPNWMTSRIRTGYFIRPDGSRKKVSSIQIKVIKNRSSNRNL